MKFVGQDEIGRLILDGEGETIEIEKSIFGESPVKITNLNVVAKKPEPPEPPEPFERRVDDIRVSTVPDFGLGYPICISILEDTDRGCKMGEFRCVPNCPGDILSIADAKRLAKDILDAVEYRERIGK